MSVEELAIILYVLIYNIEEPPVEIRLLKNSHLNLNTKDAQHRDKSTNYFNSFIVFSRYKSTVQKNELQFYG